MDAILGQDKAISLLQAALSSGRLHHAFIFHGPRGVGKFTTARAFARVLLCPNAQPDLTGRVTACGSCSSCAMMTPKPPVADGTGDSEAEDENPFDRETHPDFHVIRKELASVSNIAVLRSRKQLNIPIDLLRERMIGGTTGDDKFHEAPAYKTAQLRHNKVFIIDEAELLAREGQNALLKTLEEPPAGTFIILVTSNEDLLLPTIRSRSQRIAFAPLPEDVIGQWLDAHAGDVSARQREWLISFADGSLGRVKLAIEFDLYDWAKTVLPAVNAMATGEYPTGLGAEMAELIKSFAERWVDAHANASKDAANRQAAGLMWSLISRHARVQVGRQLEKHQAGDLSQGDALFEPWLRVIDALGDAERNLSSNVNLGLVADQLVSAMYKALSEPVAV